MELLILGSAAAEGIPALFCRCPLCRRAQALGGRDLRARCGALVNGHILVDLPPDIYHAKLCYGLDLAAVDVLLNTHAHADHFAPAELVMRSSRYYCHIPGEQPLQAFLVPESLERARQAFAFEFGGESSDPSVKLLPVNAFDRVDCGEVIAWALPACHDPALTCLFWLLVEPATRTAFLYAHDTGLPSPDTLRELHRLLDGMVLDGVSMDCTWGTLPHSDGNHMGLADNLEFRRLLLEQGSAGPLTRWYVNHFSHNCGLTHAELSARFGQEGFSVLYDGARINL